MSFAPLDAACFACRMISAALYSQSATCRSGVAAAILINPSRIFGFPPDVQIVPVYPFLLCDARDCRETNALPAQRWILPTKKSSIFRWRIQSVEKPGCLLSGSWFSITYRKENLREATIKTLLSLSPIAFRQISFICVTSGQSDDHFSRYSVFSSFEGSIWIDLPLIYRANAALSISARKPSICTGKAASQQYESLGSNCRHC